MLVDSHCHLDFPDFAETLDELIARAAGAGVGAMVTISTRVGEFDKIRTIAEAYDNVFCTIGTHPHNADEEDGITADELIDIAAHPKVVGIGECGLDYHYQYGSPEAQTAGFVAHIEAARQTGLPLIIHSRNADADTAKILREQMARGEFKAVLHCFTGSRELAMTGIELGLTISFSGILTFKASTELRDIARDLPQDRILVETDAPYLAPMPNRGKRNEPAYVAHTAAVLAETRSVSAAEIAQTTTENFARLFSKADLGALPAFSASV